MSMLRREALLRLSRIPVTNGLVSFPSPVAAQLSKDTESVASVDVPRVHSINTSGHKFGLTYV